MKAAHVIAVARKAETSHTGIPPKNPGSPGVAWPLPWSVTTLIVDLTAAMTEHAAAARSWWLEHGVPDLGEAESPWLVALSDVHVPATRGRSVGELRSLQGLGSSGFLLGSLTGRYPASVVIAVPDAGDRHQPKNGGSGRLQDYWPASLRGIKAKAQSGGLGRHAWTVGGDGALAFVDTYGVTVPSRVLSSPAVMPARTQANVVAVDHDVYEPTPVTVGRNEGVQTPTNAEPAIGRSIPVPADARAYLAALHAHVTQALGSTPTLVDVLRASAVATVQVPAPAGVTQLPVPDLAVVLITRANIAPALNVGDVRAAIDTIAAA